MINTVVVTLLDYYSVALAVVSENISLKDTDEYHKNDYLSHQWKSFLHGKI